MKAASSAMPGFCKSITARKKNLWTKAIRSLESWSGVNNTSLFQSSTERAEGGIVKGTRAGERHVWSSLIPSNQQLVNYFLDYLLDSLFQYLSLQVSCVHRVHLPVSWGCSCQTTQPKSHPSPHQPPVRLLPTQPCSQLRLHAADHRAQGIMVRPGQEGKQ